MGINYFNQKIKNQLWVVTCNWPNERKQCKHPLKSVVIENFNSMVSVGIPFQITQKIVIHKPYFKPHYLLLQIERRCSFDPNLMNSPNPRCCSFI